MLRIGIDVGGTGVQIGLIDEKLEILLEKSIPTDTSLPFSSQVQKITDCIQQILLEKNLSLSDLASVGVGIPGIADLRTGEIIKCTNMGWYHVPFRSEFQSRLNVPVFIDNDANVAALAESVAGVSAGTSSSVFITVGTGIGSGIIINGKIWNGAHGIGGELGHVILALNGIPCTCGNKGCLERYCSATALIRMGREAATTHPESLIMGKCGGDIAKIEAKTVIDCAREKDPVALEVYSHFIDNLSQAIASVINLIDPEVIVIGGGVSKAGDFLLDPIRKNVPKYVIFNDQPMPEVRLAVLGSKAGIIGASMLS